jgi:hypothetical protein
LTRISYFRQDFPKFRKISKGHHRIHNFIYLAGIGHYQRSQNHLTMPIRMEKDSPQNQGNRPGGQRGGQNSLIRWLPIILLFVFKKPKISIPILAVLAIWYFFLGGQEMLGGFSSEPGIDNSAFSLGASLSQERFDQAKVFEPLVYGFGGRNQLPPSVSLERFAPPRLHQGQQGSCVGWASAYAARSILQAKASGQNPANVTFSPSYLYNQIHLQGCQGAYMLDAMKSMASNGALPFNEFPYDESSCARDPSGNQISRARQFNIKGYNRLTLGASNYKPDVMAIKQNLAQGAPVVIGMMVGGTFMSRMVGQRVWYPSQRDYSMGGYGGHAMCVIGYNDNLEGGAFQIMNSWGDRWGDDGIAWVRYRDFEHFTKEAYGLFPMGSTEPGTSQKFEVEFGLADMASQSTIALQKTSDIVFRTINPISKNDKFKVLFANSEECYVYIFGQETDGSSYVLFPYTEKHSPYCGITGTRLFPKDYSMTPDDIGNRDYIAIVVSKTPIDFNDFNNRLTRSRQSTYAGKLREVLGNDRISNVSFNAGKTVAFSADGGGKNKVGMVIEIDKN